ncbi:hypothetical protein VTN77DRAFT_5083 [Rasamsonia byssochlamydoides]|uniref:uncharacterized protein n=1 Tax=Rasamsonia byssochlamydoides TaxID=89139 RepID=UPI003744483B
MEQSHPNHNPNPADSFAKTTTSSQTGPAATATATAAPITNGQRASITCDSCRTKDSQCDRTKCVDCRCGCTRHHHPNGNGWSQEAAVWTDKIETLENEIHRYEDIIDKLELGSDSDVMRLLQQLRSHESKRNEPEARLEDTRRAR